MKSFPRVLLGHALMPMYRQFICLLYLTYIEVNHLLAYHSSLHVPVGFHWPSEVACFLLLYISNFYTIMVIVLAIKWLFFLISYLPSHLQRSPTYYYWYIALLSVRGACYIWHFPWSFFQYVTLDWVLLGTAYLAVSPLDSHTSYVPGCSKTHVCCAANCIDFSHSKLHSIIILKPFFIPITLVLP